MTSLRSRLGMGLFLSLTMMIGLLWLIAAVSVRTLMEEQLATRLAHDGETLLGGLRFEEDGSVSLNAQRVQGIYQQPFSGHYFLIDVDGQTIRSRSLWDVTLQAPQVDVGETLLTHATGPQQQPLLVWSRGFRKQGRLVRLSVAEDLLTMQAGTRRITWRLLAWSLAMVLALLLIQRYIVARSLRPVAVATDDIARLEQGEINALGEDVPAEVRPLVREINRLLQRQQQRLLRSREAIGNLAHAIKTPLTLLQQLAREKLPDDAQTEKRLHGYNQQINELVDKSLRRARLAGDGLGVRRFDLQQDLPVLVDTLQRLHRDKPIDFHANRGGATQLPLEQQDGMELLGNLLDNAWKWARSSVQLAVSSARGVQIIIEDDGPGVDAADRQSLLQRGTRQDEHTPGHGIGLSIVKSLVEELGGRIEFAGSERLGGLRVTVYLARPEAPPGNGP